MRRTVRFNAALGEIRNRSNRRTHGTTKAEVLEDKVKRGYPVFKWNEFGIGEPLNARKIKGRNKMNLTIGYMQPAVAIIAGILILARPALLPYIVAIYLIVFGILQLVGGVRV
jgi:hypothetical protein